MVDCCDLPPVFPEDTVFRPNEIILYGTQLNSIKLFGALRIPMPIALIAPSDEDWKVGLMSIPGQVEIVRRPKGEEVRKWQAAEEEGKQPEKERKQSRESEVLKELGKILLSPQDSQIIAAIYAYAYEGRCYRLDKPRVLSFTDATIIIEGTENEGLGCASIELGYSMWRVQSSDNVIEMTVNSDTFQKLILDQNLPGKRSPNTYAANMIPGGGVAHRGGRLVES